MKTMKKSLFSLMILIFTAGSFQLHAQDRRREDSEKKAVGTVDKEFNYNEQLRHLRDDRKDRMNEFKERRENDRHPRSWRDQDYDKGREWRKQDHNWDRGNRSYDHDRGYNYYHRDYGHVYKRFSSNPRIFQHNSGRYYFYDHNFCEYRDGLGYVVVDVPYNTVFYSLPFHLKRLFIHGMIYFTYGDLWFVSDGDGFRLIPSPY